MPLTAVTRDFLAVIGVVSQAEQDAYFEEESPVIAGIAQLRALNAPPSLITLLEKQALSAQLKGKTGALFGIRYAIDGWKQMLPEIEALRQRFRDARGDSELREQVYDDLDKAMALAQVDDVVGAGNHVDDAREAIELWAKSCRKAHGQARRELAHSKAVMRTEDAEGVQKQLAEAEVWLERSDYSTARDLFDNAFKACRMLSATHLEPIERAMKDIIGRVEAGALDEAASARMKELSVQYRDILTHTAAVRTHAVVAGDAVDRLLALRKDFFGSASYLMERVADVEAFNLKWASVRNLWQDTLKSDPATSNRAVESHRQFIEEGWKEAEQLHRANASYQANGVLERIAQECRAAGRIKAAHAAFSIRSDAVDRAVEACTAMARELGQGARSEPLRAALADARAIAQLPPHDYVSASKRLDLVEELCAECTRLLNDMATTERRLLVVQADPRAAIVELRARIRLLERSPGGSGITRQMAEMSFLLDQAEKRAASKGAAEKVVAAEQILSEAQKLAACQARFDERVAGEIRNRLSLIDEQEPIASEVVPHVRGMLEAATRNAADQLYERAFHGLGEISQRLDDLNSTMARVVDVKKRIGRLRADVQALVDSIADARVHPKVKDILAKGVGGLTQAFDSMIEKTLRSPAIDFSAIEMRLNEAGLRILLTQSRMAKEGHGAGPDLRWQLRALVGKEGGPQALDDLVEALGPGDDPKIALAAMAARFKITALDQAEGSEWQAKTLVIVATYQLLMEIPARFVVGNLAFRELRFGDYDVDGSYARSCRLIQLKGKPTLARRNYGDPAELPHTLRKCDPADGAEVNCFCASVGHEVGHAVDARESFMSQNMGDRDYGDWLIHKSVADGVSNAVGAELGIEAKWIEAYIVDGQTPPDTRGAWHRVVDWAALVQHKCQPWLMGHLCDKSIKAGGLIVGGRIYQRAAEDKLWYSYSATARLRGISGYQFKAPGEWFAELFAAYLHGILKPEHPSAPWLKKLCDG